MKVKIQNIQRGSSKTAIRRHKLQHRVQMKQDFKHDETYSRAFLYWGLVNLQVDKCIPFIIIIKSLEILPLVSLGKAQLLPETRVHQASCHLPGSLLLTKPPGSTILKTWHEVTISVKWSGPTDRGTLKPFGNKLHWIYIYFTFINSLLIGKTNCQCLAS